MFLAVPKLEVRNFYDIVCICQMLCRSVNQLSSYHCTGTISMWVKPLNEDKNEMAGSLKLQSKEITMLQ